MMFESMDVAVFACWFLGGFVSGFSGIGGTMVAFPLLALLMPTHQLIPLSCILNVVMDVCLAVLHLRHCRWSILWPMLIGSIPGSFLGLGILIICPGYLLEGLVGLLLLYFVYWERTFKAQALTKHVGLYGAAAGFASSLFGTAVSIDGPPIGAYGLCLQLNPRVFLGTLGVFFVVRGTATVALQGISGFVTPEVIHYALVGVPATILGTLAAFPVAKRIPQKTFQNVLLIIIAIAGLLCLGRSLRVFF